MKAVVLVGGFGTRLRPLTLTTPKQMLPVAGTTLIERVLTHLHAHGVDEAVLSLGYKPDVFVDAYPDATCAGVALTYAVEPEPLDTAGAIRFAAEVAGIDERFLVVNGDVLTDFDVSDLVARHEQSGAEGTIYLTKVEDPSHFGVVPTDDTGRVEAFVEKPPLGQEPTDLINAGYYVLEASVLARIPTGRRVNVERETFPAMVEDGTLYAFPYAAYWIDVGTPERYLEASLDAASTDTRALGGGPATVDGEAVAPVLFGEGVTVEVGAVVVSSVLGPGCRVADGARVEGSVLLDGVVVEERAVVSDSAVGPGARIGAGATVVEYSVIGDGARVEAGWVLRGARVPDDET